MLQTVWISFTCKFEFLKNTCEITQIDCSRFNKVKQVLAKLVVFILTSYFKNTSKIEKHVEKIVKELTKLEIRSGTNVKNCWTTRENAEHRIKPRYVRLIDIRLILWNKVHKIWEGHKILRNNLHRRFDRYYLFMPCPFTGPKIFLAGPNFLCQTKNLFTYCGSHKHFAPDKKMICIQ